MKLLIGLLFTTLISGLTWKTNFIEAKTEAASKHELILLNFSGSDWCLPCVRLRKTIFESDYFTTYAADNLVLLNADFPRLKKNKLSAKQVKMNEQLAEKYNPDGKFPYTILLTAEGKVLKTWDGLPNVTEKRFIEEIKQLNAYR